MLKVKANGDAKIIGLIRINPFRINSERHDQYELAIKSGTISKFVKAGGDLAYLNWYAKHGLIKVK